MSDKPGLTLDDVPRVWSHRPDLEPAEFARTAWGHRGYDEVGVDSYVDQVARDRDAADQQISDLRAEVDRLHRYIRRQWAAVAAAESGGSPADRQLSQDGGSVSPAAQARAVLSQAQEIAERRLAEADARLEEADRVAADRLRQAERRAEIAVVDAERQASRLVAEGDEEAADRLTRVDAIAEQVLIEAREDAERRRARAQDDCSRMLLLARTRYEDIVVRAHQRADRAAEVALDEFEDPRTSADGFGRVRAELEMKAAYLRTFAKVSRAALQAALDVTAREFDRLLGASASREPGFALLPVGPMPVDPALVLEAASAVPAQPAPAQPAPAQPAPAQPVPVVPAPALRPRPRMIVLPDTQLARAGRRP